MQIIDVTMPVYPGCPAWPGDGDFEHRTLCTIKGGAICNTSAYSAPAHLGTHIDAPKHFFDDGATVDQLAPERFMGPATVINVETEPNGDVTAKALTRAVTRWPDRLLLRTRNSAADEALSKPQFDRGFCALTPEAAELIVSHNVRLIGLDYYSIGPFNKGLEVHRTILGAGIIALEGLDLRNVAPGEYTLIALPTKLVGLDGAPVRAVLIQG